MTMHESNFELGDDLEMELSFNFYCVLEELGIPFGEYF